MTLPTTGELKMSNINDEIGKYGTWAQFWLSHADARALAGVPSGAIAFSNFRGKSRTTPLSASASGGSDVGTSYGNPYTARATATAYPNGGSGGYTYQWYVVSGSALDSTTSQSASISMQVRYGGNKSCQCYCVVTDSGGNTYTTNTVTLTIAYDYQSGGGVAL